MAHEDLSFRLSAGVGEHLLLQCPRHGIESLELRACFFCLSSGFFDSALLIEGFGSDDLSMGCFGCFPVGFERSWWVKCGGHEPLSILKLNSKAFKKTLAGCCISLYPTMRHSL